MDSWKLQDRLYLGLGQSARHIGRSADAFRPDGPSEPLKMQNRFLRLPAAFVPSKGGICVAETYGQPLWNGIFDASYTRVGDYIVLGTDAFFIASQAPLLPVLCVKANRTISIARPILQTATGLNTYGGFTLNNTTPLMEAWPASVLNGDRAGTTAVGLPTDQTVLYLNILVPAPPNVVLLSGDRISDETGCSATISSAELTNLGWRVTAKMATDLMPDISDIEQAFINAVSSSLYPNGPTDASVVGALCRVYRGWPNTATLNTDLTAGAVNVSIAADNDRGMITTRYLPEWRHSPLQPGVTATATGSSIAIAGTPTVGDVIGVLADGKAYTYRIQSGDSVELIAANLAQLIQCNHTASAQGPTISLTNARSILARTVRDCPAFFEGRRQEKDVRIICWCPSPSIRDSVAAAIDSALDQAKFLTLVDNTAARIVYRNTAGYDQAQNALLYRRDLVYTAEYPTVTTLEQPSMLFGASLLNANTTYS